MTMGNQHSSNMQWRAPLDTGHRSWHVYVATTTTTKETKEQYWSVLSKGRAQVSFRPNLQQEAAAPQLLRGRREIVQLSRIIHQLKAWFSNLRRVTMSTKIHWALFQVMNFTLRSFQRGFDQMRCSYWGSCSNIYRNIGFVTTRFHLQPRKWSR